jgi:hypothetical protein
VICLVDEPQLSFLACNLKQDLLGAGRGRGFGFVLSGGKFLFLLTACALFLMIKTIAFLELF